MNWFGFTRSPVGPLAHQTGTVSGARTLQFVGRSKEWEIFRLAAQLAKSGSGQLIAIAAEPGVGKSRLVFEFKAEAGGDWTVMEAFSVSHGKGSLYLPVIELLHGYLESRREMIRATRRGRIAKRVAEVDASLEAALPYVYALLEIEDDKDVSPAWTRNSSGRARSTLSFVCS